MKDEVQDFAEYSIHIMKALTKAHMRFTEHQRYAESGTPPKGMTFSLHINSFRPRDSPIAQTLAEHKKEYHAKILDFLVTHYLKVIATLAKDQRVAADREKALRKKYPGDPIWTEYNRAIQEGAVESSIESSGLFNRMTWKRQNDGTNNNTPSPKRVTRIHKCKKTRGRPRPRRSPRATQEGAESASVESQET